MRMKISIKRAVIIPFILVVIVIMIIVGVVWQKDYQWQVDNQGSRILRAINENTFDRLQTFVKNPLRTAKIYAMTIERNKMYADQDMSGIERYSIEYLKQMVEDSPQISSIGYGNEKGDYLGVRYDESTKTMNLMLKDARTKGLLNIYEGLTVSSKVLASYKDYDPRVRPWYAPVKVEQRLQWSDFYINFDEKKEATISILVPIFNVDKKFEGVVVTDVKLDGINQFLRAEHNKGAGAVYIADPKGQIIGHSEMGPVVVELKKGPPAEGRLILAVESQSELIKNSALKLMNLSSGIEGKFEVKVTGERSFGWVSRFSDPSGLNWNVVAVLPEKDLMGAALSHQRYSLLVIFAVGLLGLISGLIMLSKLTQPIIKTSNAISEMAQGNWEAGMHEEGIVLKETSDLVQAFNNMAIKLNTYITNLRDSEEKYRTLVENSDDMIYSLDSEDRFVSVNGAFERFTGMDRNEIIGKDLKELMMDESEFHKWYSDLSHAINGKVVYRGVTHVVSADGNQIMFNMTLIPLKDENGKVIGNSGTNHNITDLLEMEAEKISSLSFVVTGVAHEINTPVGNCITVVSYMMAELDEIEGRIQDGSMKRSEMNRFIVSFKESCSHVIRNLEKSRQLVESFKELASNRSVVDRVEIHLAPFIESVHESVKWMYPEKTVTLGLSCSPDLTLLIEHLKITQVFSELIANSYLHGFDGRENGKIEIDISGPDQKNFIYINYRDNGAGVSKEIIKDVFTPFFSTKFGSQHSGLGLNVVYNIVRGSWGGEIIINENFTEGFEIKMVIKKE